jgi:hypothetical protein
MQELVKSGDKMKEVGFLNRDKMSKRRDARDAGQGAQISIMLKS